MRQVTDGATVAGIRYAHPNLRSIAPVQRYSAIRQRQHSKEPVMVDTHNTGSITLHGHRDSSLYRGSNSKPKIILLQILRGA
jgi:hypothetical protein